MNTQQSKPLVGIVMGSPSDAPTMKKCADILDELSIPYEMKICSAHRTPERAHTFATTAAERGIKVVIAAAGMSAHLAGVMAAYTHIPVLGVPMDGKLMGGLDALLSTCNMPKGIPVGTMSMGSHGAVNAALFAVSILATSNKEIEAKYIEFRKKQSAAIPEDVPVAE
ncbi:N5-carboxyaminoimidazole ribonucleotide mutase [Poriferisphaera corsica]|uniref:N5-carboxyaminoimidazole ribonucleotide mutase n=1 Tax=Poriferisphaera corsica TaxID=2528020 RepID=A0A517YR31_9BACT|nr:5-(carboxyamino)imidazole ribonucleotide mutase [Poriferisphaera corsica]QDU32679.1 N5-carboxyaminoimidazole ribonucleotide mutase [Poriferisphaera corsica]